jgi:hypothetical protein
LHADSRQILGIYRNYKQDDKTFKRRAMFVHYYFLPGPGFLGLGYLHLIGGLTEAANASLRHLITAGAFANFPGGFVAKNAKITGGQGCEIIGSENQSGHAVDEPDDAHQLRSGKRSRRGCRAGERC